MVSPLTLAKRIIDPNEREIARLTRRARAVTALEPEFEKLSDEQLAAKTVEFRQRLAKGETLDDLLDEAFATAREAARRVLGERPYDVQLIGAMILHEGKIAEMKTGEGKTLTATVALYLNALLGRGCHLVTTNDFLVRWQAEWMGQVFSFLGMTVGYIQHNMPPSERRAMYQRDVTYVENSELGFDYLRDNMTTRPEHLALRDLYFAIVDECDSILIDEARTPLIISGETTGETQNYKRIDELTRRLLRAHTDDEPLYVWDKKDHQASLTEAGQEYVERELRLDGSLVDPENIEIAQLVDNALKAYKLYEADVDYVVREGEVVIVDEFTGHLQPGRRYSDGLHQAIEAKERVHTPRVRQTVASITYQNFFRLYDKLAGMTGTAKSEEHEFTKIYGCRVVVAPTNKPVARIDHPDMVFKTQEAKYRAIVNEIINCHVREQPTLVGTRSVEVSEHLAGRLAGNWLRAHALVQILLHKLHDAGKDIDRDRRDSFLACLRQPMERLVDQARHLRRRNTAAPKKRRRRNDDDAEEQASEYTLGDIVAELGVPENLDEPANIEYLLDILGIVEKDTSPELKERYLQRLAGLIAEGMRPGDENTDSFLNVLNAKRHEAEGMIIARAGEPGMVTIATNMAGRGVDIILGGRNPAKGTNIFPEKYEYVKSIGGLHVIGTERHESRRIDDQLRGRSGRQGDPGSSRFYIALEDELMALFGPGRFGAFMNSWPEEEAIEARLVTRAIERAQEKVELRNFGYRKHTHDYDNVMDKQRSVIYAERRRVLNGENVHDAIMRMIERTANRLLQARADAQHSPDEWQIEELYSDLVRIFSTPPEDEEKRAKGRRGGGGGIAVTLAERDLLAMAIAGENIAEYLCTAAEPHGSLRRNVDQETARQMLRDEIKRLVDQLMATYCPPKAPPEKWRLREVVRALDTDYEGIADDLGRHGLLAIPAADLHDEVLRMVLETYRMRELARVDLDLERAFRHFASPELPVEKADFIGMIAALEQNLHDLRPRLAVDALEEMELQEIPGQIVQLTNETVDELSRRQSDRDKGKGSEMLTRLPASEDLPELNALMERCNIAAKPSGRRDLPGFVAALAAVHPLTALALAVSRLRALHGPEMGERLRELVREDPQEGENAIGDKVFRRMERFWLLSSVDKGWMQHLLDMDELRDGIHLRGHAQRDPLVEYQREASDLFENLLSTIEQRTTQKAFSATEVAEMDAIVMRDLHEQREVTAMDAPTVGGTVRKSADEPRRNDPCPCGSGKKYKMCCMRK